MRFIPRFGKPAYQAPHVAPVPEGQAANQNAILINEGKRQIQVVIFDGGKPEDIYQALGMLEVAKDIVKSTISSWHDKDRRIKGIIRPAGGNGNG